MSEKIGIFGGTFNPFHMGHLNSIRTVMKRAELDKIYVVPASQNPLKKDEDMPSPEDRLEMVKIALRDEDDIVIDDQEIRRGDVSYTIETLRYYVSKFGSENVYLIMGADAFGDLDLWKNYEDILKETNVLVTTRPNSVLPLSISEFPKGIQGFVKDFNYSGVATLKTGRKIQFLQLKDVDVSASSVRKKLRSGKSVDKALAIEVEKYIKEKELYSPISGKIPDFEKFTGFCSQVMFDKKAINVKGYDLRKVQAPSEYALICSGTSTRTSSALAENIRRAVKEEYGVNPLSVEGMDEGRWVLLDYGSLIIHIFYELVRNEYRLEDLWKTAKPLGLQDKTVK